MTNESQPIDPAPDAAGEPPDAAESQPVNVAPVKLRPGQKVSTPHRKYMGAEGEEGVYVGDAPDHVVGPMLDGHSDLIPMGRVRYADGETKDWQRHAIEPLP